MKTPGNWKGPTTKITTTEYENGGTEKVKVRFRVYSSYLETLSDYVSLISCNPRYAAVTAIATVERRVQALQNVGYATGPNHAQKLTSMTRQLKSMSEKVSKTYSTNIDSLS